MFLISLTNTLMNTDHIDQPCIHIFDSLKLIRFTQDQKSTACFDHRLFKINKTLVIILYLMSLHIIQANFHFGTALIQSFEIQRFPTLNKIIGRFNTEYTALLQKRPQSHDPFLTRRIDSSYF